MSNSHKYNRTNGLINGLILISILYFTNYAWANTSSHEKELVSWASSNNIVGAAMSVDKKTNYYGYSEKFKKIKVNQDTVFGIGSVTKKFVSVTLLLLEEKGVININDNITD